ncbi:unnamed protein product, partial [Linum tenue]
AKSIPSQELTLRPQSPIFRFLDVRHFKRDGSVSLPSHPLNYPSNGAWRPSSLQLAPKSTRSFQSSRCSLMPNSPSRRARVHLGLDTGTSARLLQAIRRHTLLAKSTSYWVQRSPARPSLSPPGAVSPKAKMAGQIHCSFHLINLRRNLPLVFPCRCFQVEICSYDTFVSRRYWMKRKNAFSPACKWWGRRIHSQTGYLPTE